MKEKITHKSSAGTENGAGRRITTRESNSNDSKKRRAQDWHPRAPR
jgi:hypothetical protein